jgi:ribosome biogenesis GTPase
LIGTVYSGINNIFRIRGVDNLWYECRIKGKILKDEEESYNPLAPGDMVEFEQSGSGQGLILSRSPRKNRFARWNRKKEAWQVVAVNLDIVLAVVSAAGPPFRPRFVDRVLIAAAQGDVPAAILVNKVDQGVAPWVDDRIRDWERLGFRVLRSSAETGEGLEDIVKLQGGGTMVLFGPSGVGKSTILNRLIPGLDQVTGEISEKHDRGRHVTNFGRLIDAPWGGRVVDTPGVREILVRGIAPEELIHWFPEFEEPSAHCSFQPCSHRHEPDCGVIRAVEAGRIHMDRYENYLRIRDELEDEARW